MEDPGEFDAMGDMKSLFKNILGSDITIKDNLKATEENVLIIIIDKLDNSRITEETIFDIGGIDIKQITDPLWVVVESLMKMTYGVEACGIIFWYLYERHNPDGTIIDLYEEETEKSFKLKSSKDLFSYIKHRFPKS